MNKRLIILLSILAAVVLLVILGSATFTLQSCEVHFYLENGSQTTVPSDLTGDALIGDFKGKSIFSLDEHALADSINDANPSYYCIDVVRTFPNKAVIHMAQREGVFFMRKNDLCYLIDVYGWVIKQVDGNPDRIDISNMATYVDTIEVGKEITWLTQEWQNNFSYLQTAVKSIWKFYYDYADMRDIVNSFSFDGKTMRITTVTDSRIIIKGTDKDLASKVENSISVYRNSVLDVTLSQITITVDEQGNIKTD